MSINGSVASFLPFTINGLTDASFSNSNLGAATATSLTLSSATPLKLARFDLDKNLVSASVDESEVAVLTSNVFDGTQTMKPGHTTNINNVFETTIVPNPPYDKSSFTTSGISGYTAPLGTITGPVAGEYSISQTADDRSIMKLDSFVPEAGRKYVYTFTMRIIDAPEAYVSVEQGGVQRSNTIIQIGSNDETISDTFTYDPAGSTLVFKIYTGSLDPWTATWSSFSLGYYEASINAPINALTITNLATELLTIPSTSSNSESWSIYAISTMGNPSTLGGIIFQEATAGVGAYITDGVVGAKSFQFNTLSGNAGKVVVTNADQVMSTSINAGQLDYITGLTSQAGGVGQVNTWTDTNNFHALRITSTIATQDYSLSVNVSNQLEINNLATFQTLKTDGASIFLPAGGNLYGSATTYSGDLQLAGTSYFAYGTGQQWGTNLNSGGEYEIQDDAGVMRMRLSKSTGLTVSTLNVTQVPSATPSLALGVNGGGQVVSFAVPTATNILPLANTFTNTNDFLSTFTTGVGYTTSINGALNTTLNDLGFTSASFTTSGITGAYTPPLGTITNPSGSTYQITQTAGGRSIMAISGFTPSVGITYVFSFNIKCTIGTATISVEQDNIMVSPALYPLTTGFNRVVGSFTYNGTPNTVVFKIYTGVASWNAQWDSFVLSTYTVGLNANMNCLTLNNRITQRYNALAGDVSTLVNRATMDSAISAGSIVNLNNTFIGTNAFNNDVSLGVSTVVVNQQSITTSILQTAGISSQALGGTAVISGSYLLTPTPTTFPYASVYSPTQTFLANAKYNYLFTGFTAGIFGVSLTVYQANVANTGFIAISSTVPVVVGTFSGIFTPNSNPSYLGQVYFTFSGINSKTVGWTTFTYQRGMETVNGELTVNGDTTLGTTSTGNLTVRATNTITKVGGNSGANFFRVFGNDAGSSPYAEYYFNNLRRCFMGNATATEVQIACENNAQLNIFTQSVSRMIIDTAGNIGFGRSPGYKVDVNGAMRVKNDANANDSKTVYGPNASWSAFLVVGSGTDSSGPSTAQCISTNGNLHLDGGNSNDIYYGYYPFSRGTPNVHRWYGGSYVFDGLPQNTAGYSQVMCLDGTTLRRSQCTQRLVYFSNNVAWGGGVNMVNAFFLHNTTCSVQFWGKNSGYYSGAGMMQTTIRVYSQSTGAYYYYPINAFVNVGYNHFTVPLNYATTFPSTGWYDIFVYSTSGWITDGNDQLTIGVSILPVSSF